MNWILLCLCYIKNTLIKDSEINIAFIIHVTFPDTIKASFA